MFFLAVAYLAVGPMLASASPRLSGDVICAKDVIEKLHLVPNQEKGFYRQTYLSPATGPGNRSVSSAIYYLLEGREKYSHWHKVDATEIWHYYAGEPLLLELSWSNGTATQRRILGSEIFDGHSPQVVIPANQWQRAQSLGEWTLVGTTMAPAFSPDGFQMPDPGNWEPDDRNNTEGLREI